MVRRGFTLSEMVAVVLIIGVLLSFGYVSYGALRSEQANTRARTSLMAATMAQRNAAANSGGFVLTADRLGSVMGGADIVDAGSVSATSEQVSMRAEFGAVWLVAQGGECLYTYIAPIADDMVVTEGTLTEGTCSADNPSLPGVTE